MSALFLSPHPDDAELFCGATIAALGARSQVWIADLTRGELSSNGDVQTRAEEARAAAARLGVQGQREQLGLPDGGLLAHDEDQLRAIVELIRRLRPELLVAPWVQDRHPDHVAAGQLARAAMRLAGATAWPCAEPAFAPRRLLFYPCHTAVEPSLLVDVSGSIQAWEEAVACYRSQFLREEGLNRVPTPINQPGFIRSQLARRELWGTRIGVAHAEAFIHEGPWPARVQGLLEG
ncbi:bacillithiol biosynthesis deacetylase BshB1 [bacterium]|nr:MAG: bacillithiol biosynthesis deacetylase BshB1 [bacterium]RKZ18210.1 MAG: bacillithiol biosynthesis deacetylase BshB1 [bacterium]